MYRLVSRLWIFIYIYISLSSAWCLPVRHGWDCIALAKPNIYNQCISLFFQQNTISTKTFAMQSHCGMVSSLGFSKPIWPEWGGFSKPGWWLFQAPLAWVGRLFQAWLGAFPSPFASCAFPSTWAMLYWWFLRYASTASAKVSYPPPALAWPSCRVLIG